jgi:hypothetical protein
LGENELEGILSQRRAPSRPFVEQLDARPQASDLAIQEPRRTYSEGL